MSFKHLYCGAWNFKVPVSGVVTFRADDATGEVVDAGVYGADHAAQSIIALAGDFLVSVCEYRTGGKVLSYRINEDGSLNFIDVLEVDSALLSYITAAPNNKYVFTSSMGNGTVRMIKIEDDGKLTLKDEFRLTGHSVTPRQNCAKTHSVMVSPDGSLLAAANLGVDEVELFKIDYEKERLCLLSSNPVDFGKEPRHMAFHPSGKYLYVLTESGNRLYVFLVRGDSLQELAVYKTLDPNGVQSGSAADIVLSKDARFIYTTNRAQNNIAVWKILDSGLLDNVGYCFSGGEGPRGLNISPDGKTMLCANNGDGTVVAMEIDTDTGLLGEAYVTLSVVGAGCVRSV